MKNAIAINIHKCTKVEVERLSQAKPNAVKPDKPDCRGEWSPRTQNQQIDKYPPLLVMDTNQFVIKTPRLLPAGGGGAGEND